MIQTLIGPLAQLAGGWLEGRKAKQAAAAKLAQAEADARAEVVKQAAKSEASWNALMARNSGTSWKDEYITILVSVPLILAFAGDTGREIVAEGFAALETMPAFYQYTLGVVVAGSFGLRGAAKIIGRRPK